jgi:transposase
MKLYTPSAVERAMKVQEVILRAMSGEISWIGAAEIIGISDRSMRRWRKRYEEHGYDGLLDRRTGRPSPRKAPFEEVQRILRLYREKYLGFNVRHFHQIVTREYGVELSYTFVKKALQGAGLVKKRKAHGRHFQRREPRPCFGELLHVDGSLHGWLALDADERQTLIAVLDDATKWLLYAQLWPEETSEAVMTALKEVVETYGIPMALYSDRASWAFYTPKAGGGVDKGNLTQVGRALARLGVEHIPAYTPQARGRSERLNRTLQDRLVNELRAAGIATPKVANHYLRQHFIPQYNQDFTRPPRDPYSVFVSAHGVDLEQIFCFEEPRIVAKDNTVRFENLCLQMQKQPGRTTCAGLKVTVRRHLAGSHSVWLGQRKLGIFDSQGNSLLKSPSSQGGTPLRSTTSAPFPLPQTPHIPTNQTLTGHFICQNNRTS